MGFAVPGKGIAYPLINVCMLLFQAYAISAIAHWDWPENWSDLFNQLAQYLESGEAHVVHGTLRVLTGKG